MSQAPSELRLLAGANDGPGLAAHLNRFGPMPTVEGKRPERVARLHGLIESSGLLGRGGSGVPAVWKFDFLARTNKAVIVVNCMEGEPASSKDAVLATRAPHLVLDGAAILAETLHAARVVVAVADDADPTASAFAAAIDERRDWRTAEIERPPARYIAGEESALVNWLHRGASLPTFRPTKPSYVTIRGREALVHHAETHAQLALIARFGSLAGVLGASRAELVACAGIGEATAFDLKLAYEMTLRGARAEAGKRPVVSSWSAVVAR